jgi:membrane protein implicated in regulation of membrane protease activity
MMGLATIIISCLLFALPFIKEHLLQIAFIIIAAVILLFLIFKKRKTQQEQQKDSPAQLLEFSRTIQQLFDELLGVIKIVNKINKVNLLAIFSYKKQLVILWLSFKL